MANSSHRRFLLGAEAEGLFTLFAIAFFLMAVILFGIGLLGEYVGRIYQQVRGRPRFVVQTILELNTNESNMGIGAKADKQVETAAGTN